MARVNAAAKLRGVIEGAAGRCVAAPGAFNGLVAKAVAAEGFSACYISGAATSVAYGVPDVGLLTMDHFARTIAEVASASGLPVIADADTGFGEAEMVRRTVIEYAKAGAAGLHLEDQQFPKRCGHLDGKALVSTEHMVEKVRWAAKAAADVAEAEGLAAPAMVICARTDARGVEGFEAAVVRARAYLDAGAEMIFPEGLASVDEFARFAKEVRATHANALLLANMTEFGKTPMIRLSEFAAMGYNVVIYPVTMLRVAMGAVTAALRTLKTEGTAEPLLGAMQTRKALYELVEYTPGVAWEGGIGGKHAR